jgi:hypothetical protein
VTLVSRLRRLEARYGPIRDEQASSALNQVIRALGNDELREVLRQIRDLGAWEKSGSLGERPKTAMADQVLRRVEELERLFNANPTGSGDA